MSLQKILIIIILVFVFWFFIFSSTFSTDDKIWWDIKIWYTWFSNLTQSWKTIPVDIDQSNLKIKTIYTDNLNTIDNVYLYWEYNWFYKKNFTDTNSQFVLWDGIFLFNISDLSNNYSIKSSGFIIKPLSPWKIYIDSRDKTKVKVFSFDSVFTLELTDTTSNQVMTKLNMYPKFSISFNIQRNKILKNADLLRLETISDITYIEWNIIDSKIQLNNIFYNELYNIKDDSYDFLASTLSTIYLDYKSTLDGSPFLVTRWIPGASFINQYFSFFYNDSKKIAYYKVDIIDNINNLLKDTSNAEALKQRIIQDLGYIKDIDVNTYTDFKKVIEYYYKISIRSKDYDTIETTYLLSQILHSYKNLSIDNISKSNFYLNKTYSLSDLNWFDSQELQKQIMVYINNYFTENDLSYDKNKYILSIGKKTDFTDLQYLNFFIKGVLLNEITPKDTETLYWYVDFLWVYYSINNSLVTMNSSLVTQDIIIKYSNILNLFLSDLRNNFFENDLDSDWLLVVNKNFSLNTTNLYKLRTLFNLIIWFTNSNKELLSNKNIIYLSYFSKFSQDFDKYYLAFSNFEEYTIRYNPKKSELFNSNTLANAQVDTSLSIDKLTKYLSYFNWVELNWLQANIVNGTYYLVKNINISWENFSFELYPNEGYKLDKIKKWWSMYSQSYELADLKPVWDKYKELHSDDENPDKYDFKNFFTNTFFGSDWAPTAKNFVSTDNSVKEDKLITIFKRDKLLWDRWDFSVLNWYFDIAYNDLKVNYSWDNYDIKINSWSIKTSVENWNEKSNMIVNMDSDYMFSSTKHYFYNIKLKLIDPDTVTSWQDQLQYLLWWNIVSVSQGINTIDFEKTMDLILTNINNSLVVYNQINTAYWIQNISINYNQDWKIIYSFNYKQKPMVITLKDWIVLSLMYNQKNQVSPNTKYSDIWWTLYLLK